MMLADEWTEESAEMNFRVNNLEVANRGTNIERQKAYNCFEKLKKYSQDLKEVLKG